MRDSFSVKVAAEAMAKMPPRPRRWSWQSHYLVGSWRLQRKRNDLLLWRAACGVALGACHLRYAASG
jgi:hypothetical protein